MADPKRLITGFLVLATLVGFAALTFSNFSNFGNEDLTLKNPSAPKEQPFSQIGEKAFVEPIPQNSIEGGGLPDQEVIPPEDLPEFAPSSNLTQNLAQNLTLEVLKANPEGPKSLGDEFSFNNLDETVLEKTAVLSIDDLGLNQKVLEKNLKITEDGSDAAVLNYINGINKIIGETTASENYKRLVSQKPGPEMAAAAELTVTQAYQKTVALEAPRKVAKIHQEMATALDNQRKIFEAISNYEVDPLKAVLALQAGDQVIKRDSENFAAEFNRVQFPSGEKLSQNKKQAWLGLVYSFMTIQKAQAQLFVPIDCLGPSCLAFQTAETTATAGNLLQKLFEWGKAILTEQLKDRLIQSMVQQTTTWIQGGGKPKFMTDLKGFVLGEVDKTIGNEIYRHMPGLCLGLQPWVKIAFQGPANPRAPNYTDRTLCTVSQVAQNIKDFYDDFGKGGWTNYVKVIEPRNNPFGVSMILSDLALTRAQEQKAATQQKTVAGQGFLSTKICKNKESLDLDNLMGPPGPAPEEDAKYMAANAGFDYLGPVKADNSFEVCPPDGWEETTPGSTIAGTLSDSLSAPLHRIVNARDLTDLISALVNSALTRLIKAGTDGLGNLFTGSEVNGQTFVPGTYQLEDLCSELSGDSRLTCLQNAGQAQGIQTSTSTSPINSCAGLKGQAFTNCINNLGLGTGTATSSPPGAVNIPPTFTSLNGPASAVIGLGLISPSWSAKATDPEGMFLTYTFDWGDGNFDTVAANSGSVVSKSHNYGCASVCNYTLKVTVSDGFRGNTVTRSMEIQVTR